MPTTTTTDSALRYARRLNAAVRAGADPAATRALLDAGEPTPRDRRAAGERWNGYAWVPATTREV